MWLEEVIAASTAERSRTTLNDLVGSGNKIAFALKVISISVLVAGLTIRVKVPWL